jgi:hypothetical protein
MQKFVKNKKVRCDLAPVQNGYASVQVSQNQDLALMQNGYGSSFP